MKTVLITALLCALLWIFRQVWLAPIGEYLMIQDRLEHADVIHVIAGSDYRTDYAIQIYKEGYADTVFFTGGWCKEHEFNHGEHAKEISLGAGGPRNAIAIDDAPVTSTYMEAERLKWWIDHSPRSIHSVIVVSDPFHMRRASWTYRWVLGEQIQVQMAPVPIEETPYRRAWWQDSQSRKYVREEYQKLAYYVLRYRLSSGRLKEWLASLDQD